MLPSYYRIFQNMLHRTISHTRNKVPIVRNRTFALISAYMHRTWSVDESYCVYAHL